MTKQEFFAGILFQVGDGYQYHFKESMLPSGGMGMLRRCLIGQNEWQYCGSVQLVNERGVRVFEYWLGKRVSRFLFYSKLEAMPEKYLGDGPTVVVTNGHLRQPLNRNSAC